jgi:hypothetical protein
MAKYSYEQVILREIDGSLNNLQNETKRSRVLSIIKNNILIKISINFLYNQKIIVV